MSFLKYISFRKATRRTCTNPQRPIQTRTRIQRRHRSLLTKIFLCESCYYAEETKEKHAWLEHKTKIKIGNRNYTKISGGFGDRLVIWCKKKSRYIGLMKTECKPYMPKPDTPIKKGVESVQMQIKLSDYK